MKKSTIIFFIFICMVGLLLLYKHLPNQTEKNRSLSMLYGPFRSAINIGLEWKMDIEQRKGNAYEVMQLGEWLAKLQPNNPKIWEYLAWNMAYNMVTYFPDPEIRWRYTRHALRFLLEDGLRFMPENILLQESAGELIYDKIAGGLPDPFSPFFRVQFSKEIAKYMPNGSISDLNDLVDSKGVVNDSGLEFKTTWHLDFNRMLNVDTAFGPFDWRQPYAFVIYYKTRGDFESFYKGSIGQNLSIYLSWRWACENGRLLLNPLKYSYLSTFDIGLADKIHNYLEYQITIDSKDIITTQHDEFIKGAAAMLFVNNQVDSARNYYEHFFENMPEKKRPTFNDFIQESTDLLLNSERVFTQKTVVETALVQSLLAQRSGDEQLAIGYFKLAVMLWNKNQETFANAPAKKLPPFDEMLKAAKLLRDEMITSKNQSK